MTAEWVEAIATGLAALMAFFAFFQSQKTRKNSAFNALFSQLIANHKEVSTPQKVYEILQVFL